jgi:hypothetical protein
MKLTLEKLISECPGYHDVVALNLDCKRLSKISEIGKCRCLQYISLRFNQLTSIDELGHCNKLWVIDLLQNHLTDISVFKDFQVIGNLSLGSNKISLKALESLQNTYVINLNIGNGHSRGHVINLLPRLWVLNDVYITEFEKSLHSVQEVPCKRTSYAPGPAAEFLNKFQNQPTEYQKFEYLIYDLEKLCSLEWEIKNNLNKKIQPNKFAKFQLSRWEDIQPASKLVLACTFYLYLEGFYTNSLVKDIVAILVTESYPENTPLIEAVELCELQPHYLLSFIIFLKSKSDKNPLWKRIDIDYLIKNFYSIQINLKDSKVSSMLSIYTENEPDRKKILENRQHLSLFLLTVLIRFEIINQLLYNKKKSLKTNHNILEGLLEYANIDEETLMSNIPDELMHNPKEMQSSVLSYSKSLQNLQISENNSSRYGKFLVKTRGNKSYVQEDSLVLNKFEELNSIKKLSIPKSKKNSLKIETEITSKEILPPIVTVSNKLISNQSLQKDYSSDYKTFYPSEVYSIETSDKPEFMLGSSNYFKRKKDWKSIRKPPTVYSLSNSESNLRITSHKTLPNMPNSMSYLNSYYEDVLKASITISNDPYKLIDFNISYPVSTFLTRLDQEPERTTTEIPEDPPSIKFELFDVNKSARRKWYPVPKKIRFVVDDNFVQNLKPCNFYEEHKELLPPIPERIHRKASLMLQGRQPEVTNVTKEIVKDSQHLLRVISRENTPWVQYQLKPKNKIKQDTFCANYGELLVWPI